MRAAVLIFTCLVTAQASAGVYKCKIASGDTVYQSSPCEDAQSNIEINTKTGAQKDLDIEKSQELAKQNMQQAELEKLQAAEEEAKRKQEQLKLDVQKENELNMQMLKERPKQFSPYALPPYALDNLSPLLKNYRERLPEIERLRRKAADKALASEQCGRVEGDELSPRSTKETLVIMVECSSGKSFHYSETELAQ